jgi:hypothetical protein
MLIESQATDPAVHEAAMKMARQSAWFIQAILREEERQDALREADRGAREGLEGYRARPGSGSKA